MNTRIITSLAVFLLLAISGVLFLRTDVQEDDSIRPPPGEPQVYRLHFGHDEHPGSAQHQAALLFAERVQAKSNGRLLVEVFPSQQLGNDHQMIESARQGKLAITLPPTAKLSDLVPSFQYADLPFLFPSRDDVLAMLDGEPGQILLKQLEPHGLVGATFWEAGFRSFTANKPLRSPEDFQGLNFRVMKSPLLMDQFEAFGARPIPIDFHQTYRALKDGVIDGQENPLSSIVSMKFHEVQSHLTLSRHAYLATVFVFSKTILESLPPDLQRILLETAREITPIQRQDSFGRENGYLKILEDANVQIVRLTEAEFDRYRTAVKPLIDQYRPIVGEELLAITEAYLRKKRQEEEDTVVIGLNVDLVLSGAPSGLAIQRGTELAIEEINRNGGVLGKKLRIDARDHSGIDARGISNIKQFATVRNLAAIMGGANSTVMMAEMDILHQHKIILLVPWGAATNVVENGYEPNYVFRVSLRDEYVGDFLIDQALKQYAKIALLLENTGWGRSNYDSLTSALAHRQLSPATVEWFNRSETDMTLQLGRIEQSGADVIIMATNSPDGVTIVNSMASRTNKLPIISHWGITSGDFWTQTSATLASVDLQVVQTFSFLNCHSKSATEFARRYIQTYDIDHPGEIVAPAGAAHAYDLVHLLAMAIERAGTLDRAAVRDALEQLDTYDGLVKRYSRPFRPGQHDALDQGDYFMARYDRNGHVVPIAGSNCAGLQP